MLNLYILFIYVLHICVLPHFCFVPPIRVLLVLVLLLHALPICVLFIRVLLTHVLFTHILFIRALFVRVLPTFAPPHLFFASEPLLPGLSMAYLAISHPYVIPYLLI